MMLMSASGRNASDGLNRRRVVLLSAAGELDVAIDRDDASDATQSEAVVRVWRFP